MGYNAYDHVGCCANETNLKATAEALISHGFDKLGYEYINRPMIVTTLLSTPNTLKCPK